MRDPTACSTRRHPDDRFFTSGPRSLPELLGEGISRELRARIESAPDAREIPRYA